MFTGSEIKVAIVTGASRGIGHAIALKLASEGYAIATIGNSPKDTVQDNLEQISACGQPVIYVQGSIAEKTDRQSLLDIVMERYSHVDLLVNNAGIAPRVRKDILETTEESMDEVLNVNLKGTFFLTQQVANRMIEQQLQNKSIEEMAHRQYYKPGIINISSISAYTASTQRGEYCISKAGMSMMTALFADRLAEYGILVYEIRPGIIKTDMTAKVTEKYDGLIQNGLTPIKRWGLPEDIANAVSVLCSGLMNFSTGEVINVDGGFHLRRL